MSCGRNDSLLIMSDHSPRKPDGNMSPKQTEFPRRSSSGKDRWADHDIPTLQDRSGTVVVDIGELGCGLRTSHRTSARRGSQEADFQAHERLLSRSVHRHEAPAAGHQEPLVERLQVHRAGARLAAYRDRDRRLGPRNAGARQGRIRGRHLRHGHGNRDSRRQAADHLRSVPAGRRQHEPQVPGGPWSRDQPEIAGGWRNPADERAGHGSTFTYSELCLGPAARSRGCGVQSRIVSVMSDGDAVHYCRASLGRTRSRRRAPIGASERMRSSELENFARCLGNAPPTTGQSPGRTKGRREGARATRRAARDHDGHPLRSSRLEGPEG